MSHGQDGAHRSLTEVWRTEAPYVLAALLRRHGDLGDCEDAAQEAAEAATRQWPVEGVPRDPRAWLIRVASRRLVDRVRADAARSRREDAERDRASDDARAPLEPGAGNDDAGDLLRMLLLCCHPALSRPSQVALSLRAVAGMGVAEIATAFLVPPRTMTQRLTRARATLREAGARFEMPTEADLPARVGAVLDVCYVVFTEGYLRTTGSSLVDTALVDEAIGLVRQMRAAIPDHDEVAGALALMLLLHARSQTRTDATGDLVPLAEQDRTRWRRDLVAEGQALLEEVLPRGPVGRFQLEAAIAAVHAEAASYEETDWRQISMLYTDLARVAPSATVTLNHAVAVAMAYDARLGLQMTEPLLADPAIRRQHHLYAVRAHLFERLGERAAAAEQYGIAARLTTSIPEQRYLNRRTRALGLADGP
ncbi:RNA polymerase sigma factor [Mumia sp. DW29H23]|uniref:RNA polymerase sigma factor n=1 Tax=Mumia sp. DW29H23 TaxID=3421241 RepID=UPI003D68F546